MLSRYRHCRRLNCGIDTETESNCPHGLYRRPNNSYTTLYPKHIILHPPMNYYAYTWSVLSMYRYMYDKHV